MPKFGILDKASQHSVHPTCGILRDLQAFFWLRAFSTSQALSTPTHTQVSPTGTMAQTVGTPLASLNT